jgi:anti-sigma B factor antagonist
LAATTHAPRRLKLHTLEMVSTPSDADHVVTLEGELDLVTAAHVEEELRRVEACGCRRIALDLHALHFLDSTGIHLLACARERNADSGRDLVVRLPEDGHARRVLEVSGLLRVLTLADGESLAA